MTDVEITHMFNKSLADEHATALTAWRASHPDMRQFTRERHSHENVPPTESAFTHPGCKQTCGNISKNKLDKSCMHPS